MIARDLVFHRTETIGEATEAWSVAQTAGRRPRFFSGGTETVTLTRDGKQNSTDLIDLKSIAETRVLREVEGELRLGSSLTLNTFVDRESFPLLGRCATGVADRTVRNSVTLGGNICGMLPYRETVLPFLLLDAQVELAAPGGTRSASIHDLFWKKMNIGAGEFVVAFRLDCAAVDGIGGVSDSMKRLLDPTVAGGHGLRGGWYYRRRTAEARIDYPITTLGIVVLDGELRIAVSGTWKYPYRAVEAEAVYRREASHSAPAPTRAGFRRLATAMIDAVDLSVKEDMRAGADYRRELTIQALADGLAFLRAGPTQEEDAR